MTPGYLRRSHQPLQDLTYKADCALIMGILEVDIRQAEYNSRAWVEYDLACSIPLS